MKSNKISLLARILLVVCGIALIGALYYPLWRIELDAPQYPEGLELLIYADNLGGNVDIINGLNHYIGMRELHVEDFPEFTILPGIIIFFCIAFILTAIVGRRSWLYTLFAIFVIFGVLAMVDFWRWEYEYGHDLDPNAAIIVPGMAYQPPLIGFKQLLNFGAYSIPDTGGWIFVGCGVILLLFVILEWRKKRKLRVPASKLARSAIFIFIIGLFGCSSGPQPINFGKDNCHFCKMTISDKRYAAEIVTQKGKAYKFDDSHCVVAFLKTGEVNQQDVAGTYFTDFNSPNALLESKKAFFLESEELRSPMGGNVAAFSNESEMKKLAEKYPGSKVTTWEAKLK